LYLYKKKFGSYYLEDELGTTLLKCDQVAMVVDVEDGILLKHGAPESIEQHYNRLRTMFPYIKMLILSKEIPAEEINKCLTTTGYVREFIRLRSSESENVSSLS
jgi:hypothetical protein